MWQLDLKTEKVPSLSPGRGTLTNKWASTKSQVHCFGINCNQLISKQYIFGLLIIDIIMLKRLCLS